MAQNMEPNGLQLPGLENSSSGREETVYYMEAANGMTVRVPESRLEAWQAEQERQRRGEGLQLTSSERKIKEMLLAQIYGSKK